MRVWGDDREMRPSANRISRSCLAIAAWRRRGQCHARSLLFTAACCAWIPLLAATWDDDGRRRRGRRPAVDGNNSSRSSGGADETEQEQAAKETRGGWRYYLGFKQRGALDGSASHGFVRAFVMIQQPLQLIPPQHHRHLSEERGAMRPSARGSSSCAFGPAAAAALAKNG